MVAFVVCIICGLWHLYNFVTYIHPEYMLPFFRFAGDGNALLRVVNMLCLNWSPVIGFLLIGFGVVGLRVYRLEEQNFESFKWFMVGFALLASFGLML